MKDYVQPIPDVLITSLYPDDPAYKMRLTAPFTRAVALVTDKGFFKYQTTKMGARNVFTDKGWRPEGINVDFQTDYKLWKDDRSAWEQDRKARQLRPQDNMFMEFVPTN